MSTAIDNQGISAGNVFLTMAILILVQTVSVRQLSEMQKLLMSIYFNDGHTYEFMVEFFTTIFPEERDLVITHLDELYSPKQLGFIELEMPDEE